MFEEKIVRLDGSLGTTWGILDGPREAAEAVLMVPAFSGTRIGPQRLFVELARELAHAGVASLRIDHYSGGDGQMKAGDGKPGLREESFKHCVKEAIGILRGIIPGGKIGVLSISKGCLPILDAAREEKTEHLVLLSPVFEDAAPILRGRILKAYWEKAKNVRTWKKALHGRIGWNKVFRILWGARSSGRPGADLSGRSTAAPRCLRTLIVLGGNDADSSVLKFSRKLCKENPDLDATIEVIPESDHSFFGWEFKQSVKRIVTVWLAERSHR